MAGPGIRPRPMPDSERSGGATPSSTRSTRARSPTRTATGWATLPASPPASATSPSSGVDALWLCRCFASPQVDHGYDISDYRDDRPAVRLRSPTWTADRRGARPRHQGDARPRAEPHLRPAPLVPGGGRRRSRVSRSATGTSSCDGRGRDGDAAAEQLASRSSAGRRGRGSTSRTDRPGSGTTTCSPRAARPELAQPGGGRGVRRASCGSGWTAVSTASGSTSPTRSSRTTRCPTRPTASRSSRRTTPARCTTSTGGSARVMDAYPGDRMAVIETGRRGRHRRAVPPRRTRCTWRSTSGSCTPGSTGRPLRAAIDSSLAANAWSARRRPGSPTTTTPLARSPGWARTPAAGAYVPGTMASGPTERRRRAGHPPRAGAGAAAAGAAGRRLRLQRPGAGPAQRRRPARRGPAGPDLGAQRPHGARARRLPGPMPWTTGANLGFTTSAGAGRGCPSLRSGPPLAWPRSGQRRTPCSASTASALRLRRTSPALGRGELRWVSGPRSSADPLAFDMVGPGDVRVVLNLAGAAIDLPGRRAAAGFAASGRGAAPGHLCGVDRPAGVRGAPGAARRAGPAHRRRDRPRR